MKKTRKQPVIQENFISPKGIPQGTESSENYTRDTLAQNLINFGERLKLAETYTASFLRNKRLSSEFSLDENRGDMMLAITKTCNAWESYWFRVNNPNVVLTNTLQDDFDNEFDIPVIQSKKGSTGSNISVDTDLSTFGLCVGYFRRTYDNQMSKKYTSFCTDKRSALKSVVYTSALSTDDGSQQYFDAQMASKCTGVDTLEHKNFLNAIIQWLKQYDANQNSKILTYFPNGIPSEKKSIMAKLFVMLMNPKNEHETIKKEFDFSDFVLRKRKELLVQIIRGEFKQESKEIMDYIHNKNYELIGDERESKKAKRQEIIPIKQEIREIFGMKKEGNFNKFYLQIEMHQLKDSKWEKSHDVKKLEIDAIGKNQNLSFDEAKTLLQKMK